MSIVLEENKMIIDMPNSEATINAQHKGIKDRTVSGYYLSNKYDDVIQFFNDFKGIFYVDYLRVRDNLAPLISKIENNKLKDAFKSKLIPQRACLNSIDYLLENTDGLCEIDAPSINDQRKYIKFPVSSN